MKKAKAIVTDAGGMTCHASIVSRELGIPCIVGTQSRGDAATQTIQDSAMITVDATNGIVYDGLIEDLVKQPQATEQTAVAAEYFPATGTKVYMNLGDPDLAGTQSGAVIFVIRISPSLNVSINAGSKMTCALPPTRPGLAGKPFKSGLRSVV